MDSNTRSDGIEPAASSRLPTVDNPRGYPPFDLRLVPTYTNNQLRYYHISGATLDVDQAKFKKKLEERRTALELVNWDGNTPRENTPTSHRHGTPPTIPSTTIRTLSFEHDSEADSDCPASIPGQKGLKFNPSDISRLRYDSNIAQFNNWLQDLKAAFDGDPAKYSTSRHKIILASMTIDEQLKTTYNSITQAHPAISTHWRKFRRWIKDVVLHGNSDRLKLSNEFTNARQRVSEDPNQFHLRLFNLGIQSGRTVTTEDYRTRLLKPLQNLMNQQDREYPSIQDAVTHAGKLWQTLDHDKLRQEIKEKKEKARQSHKNAKQPEQDNHPHRPSREQQRGSQRRPRQDRNEAKAPKPRLSDEEYQQRQKNDLCFNCGYPGHPSRDCSHPFNPNRVQLKDDKAKSQPSQARPRKRARAQPVGIDSASDQSDHPTDDSDESEEERPNKRQKN